MGPVDSATDFTRAPDEPVPDSGHIQAADRRHPGPRDNAGPPDRLRQRLDHLPPGHPSSPYDADGTSRQPALRLRDLDTASEDEPSRVDSEPAEPGNDADPRTDSPQAAGAESLPDVERSPGGDGPADSAAVADQTRPLTEAEWPDHRADVRGLLREADSNDGPDYTTDPDQEQWTTDRNRVQAALVSDVYGQARDVPCSGLAIIAGGLPGSGKTTILNKFAGIETSQYLMINPDNIKKEMSRRGMVPDVEGLSLMEASNLVHEESSFIAKRLAMRAMADQKNVIWDITMSSFDGTKQRISELRAAGYSVTGIFVDIPIETSIRRADSRHREDHNNYRAGNGLGGRYIPPEVIKAQADPEWGSKNRKTYETIKSLLDDWRCYDNSIDFRPARLVDISPGAGTDHEEQPS